MAMGQPALPRGGPRVWVLAARLPTLPAAVVPVLVGSAAAWAAGAFRLGPFLAALVASLLIQIGTNLANDYFDFHKGADTAERLGPVRVTQSGLVAPAVVKRAMLLTFGTATLVGLYLVAVSGWPILVVGLLSITAGVLYTGGPYPLAYHGLGDLAVFIFFGLMAVVGTAYLHTETVVPSAVVAAVPVGALVTAILVVNNLRDIDTDRAAGKHTLAVQIGRRGTRLEYVLLLLAAYAIPLLSWLAGSASTWFWLPWLTAPLAARQLRLVFHEAGRPLNAALKGTGQLHLAFGALYALSLVL
ncbi:MAG: 1,4-dihydroxy-2-naphthoate polyprenyltransferase [Chloroflexi bacterium]|nr:1,4-dihydroxy-2-naphthoate polyprenyltransferase [Chloroflexota bacterium]